MSFRDDQYWTLEGFEGELALLDGPAGRLDLPRSWLPAGAREGDRLRVQAEPGLVRLEVDERATRLARERVAALRAELRARSGDDGADLSL